MTTPIEKNQTEFCKNLDADGLKKYPQCMCINQTSTALELEALGVRRVESCKDGKERDGSGDATKGFLAWKQIHDDLVTAAAKWTMAGEIYDALKIPAMNNQAAWLKPQESNTFNALFGAPATRPISGGTGLCFLMKVSPDPAWFFCGINGGGLNSQTPVWTLGTKDTQAALTGTAPARATTPNLGHTPTYFRNNVSGNPASTWGTDAPNTRRQCGTSAGWTPYGPPSLLAAAPNDLQVRAQNGLFNFQLWGKDSSAGMGLAHPPVYGTPDGWPAPGTSPVGNYNAVFFSVGVGAKPQCGDGFPGSTESTPNPGFLACDVYARLCWAPGVSKAYITGFATMDDVTIPNPSGGTYKYSDYMKPFSETNAYTRCSDFKPNVNLQCCLNKVEIETGACTRPGSCVISQTCTIETGNIPTNTEGGGLKGCPHKCSNGYCKDGKECICAPGSSGPTCEVCSRSLDNCTIANTQLDKGRCLCKCKSGYSGDGGPIRDDTICVKNQVEKKKLSTTTIALAAGGAAVVVIVIILMGISKGGATGTAAIRERGAQRD